MRVSSINQQRNKSTKLRAAKRGAIATAALYTASNVMSWGTNPSQLRNTINEYGGKYNYAKNFAAGIMIVAAAGAVFNTVINTIIDKIHSKKSPKAAN